MLYDRCNKMYFAMKQLTNGEMVGCIWNAVEIHIFFYFCTRK